MRFSDVLWTVRMRRLVALIVMLWIDLYLLYYCYIEFFLSQALMCLYLNLHVKIYYYLLQIDWLLLYHYFHQLNMNWFGISTASSISLIDTTLVNMTMNILQMNTRNCLNCCFDNLKCDSCSENRNSMTLPNYLSCHQSRAVNMNYC